MTPTYTPKYPDRVTVKMRNGDEREGSVRGVNAKTKRAAVRLPDGEFYSFRWDELTPIRRAQGEMPAVPQAQTFWQRVRLFFSI